MPESAVKTTVVVHIMYEYLNCSKTIIMVIICKVAVILPSRLGLNSILLTSVYITAEPKTIKISLLITTIETQQGILSPLGRVAITDKHINAEIISNLSAIGSRAVPNLVF